MTFATTVFLCSVGAGCEGCRDSKTFGPADEGDGGDGVDGSDVADIEGKTDEDAAVDSGPDGPTNSFDNDFEGWTAVDLESSANGDPDYSKVLEELDDLEWKDSGGESGGYLSRTDTTANGERTSRRPSDSIRYASTGETDVVRGPSPELSDSFDATGAYDPAELARCSARFAPMFEMARSGSDLADTGVKIEAAV